MNNNDVENLEDSQICADCIGESYLRSLVKNNGKDGECSYCGIIGPVISLENMADQVEIAFEIHYRRTSSEPEPWEYSLMSDKESDYDWERNGTQTVDAIMDAVGISEDAAHDIQQILDERHGDLDAAQMGEEWEFSSDAHYEEIMPHNNTWWNDWRNFEKTIKSEARFFSRKAASQLSTLFDTIDEMRTKEGQSLIIDAGPDTTHTHLYRARVFQSDEMLKSAIIRPDKELTAPPSRFASAGRMNAKGISVFYGATSVQTTLAEVRPPVGSKVAVARFEIICPIRLLDLTALARVHESGSIFDPEYTYRLGRMMFLRELSSHIAKPVMPDDYESEYLPTQAIADYLSTEGKVPLDGILYPSVQAVDGLNVVLFHKAARCNELEFPKETKFSADIYEYYEGGPQEYHVLEEIPSENDAPDNEKHTDVFSLALMGLSNKSDEDEREKTLSVDLKSIQVHRVNAVHIDTIPFPVSRNRWSMNPPF